jgi:polyhydroxyalkanoate synthesis regulator phasin
MLDLIKKTVLTGVGLAGLTKDKVEQLARTLAKQGNLSEKEGAKLIKDLSKRADKAKRDLEQQIERVVTKTVKRINLATREDVAKLTERIRKLEQALKKKVS